jgi:protein SCO1
VRHNLGRRGGLTVLVVAVLTGLAACGGGAVKPPPPSLGTVVDFAVPASIANLPLTKPDGTTTTLAAYRGKAVMIADFLTLCTDICPLISANTVALARQLDAAGQSDDVALLEITVDPQRDTPARLRAYEKYFAPAPSGWTTLRASPADTERLWKYFGVDYGRQKEEKPASPDWLTHKPLTYDVYHSDDLIFLDASGHQRFIVNADPDTTGTASPPKALVQFLNPSGLKSLYHPDVVGDWTVKQGMQVFSWMLNKNLATS